MRRLRPKKKAGSLESPPLKNQFSFRNIKYVIYFYHIDVNNRYVLDKEFSKAKKEYCKFYKNQCEKSPKHKQGQNKFLISLLQFIEEKGQDNESDLASFIIGLDQIVKDTHSKVMNNLYILLLIHIDLQLRKPKTK